MDFYIKIEARLQFWYAPILVIRIKMDDPVYMNSSEDTENLVTRFITFNRIRMMSRYCQLINAKHCDEFYVEIVRKGQGSVMRNVFGLLLYYMYTQLLFKI